MKLEFIRHEALRLLHEIDMIDVNNIDVIEVIRRMSPTYDITLKGTNLNKLDGFSQLYNNKYLLAYDNVHFGCNRIRFSIAHEIGHIFLDHLDSENTSLDWYRTIKDTEANAFAAELLMPRFLLQEYNGAEKKGLAEMLSVSESALGYTVQNLSNVEKSYSIKFCPHCTALIYNKGRVNFCANCGVKLSA